MVCAMAVLAVKPHGWRSASEYPPIMSQIIKMSRFMVIQQAYQQVDVDHEYAAEEEPDLLRLVTGMIDRFMIRGSQGAMQWLIERTYQALEEVFTMSQSEFPIIPWDRLRDDPTREGIGHNFVKDERNPWPVNGQRWLSERLIERGVFRQRGEVISQDRIPIWLAMVDRFKALMLVCIQMVWGQPARGPEILSMCYSHSGQGEGRNVFIAGGSSSENPHGSAVELVTRYHKGYNISGDVKVIHRYLPPVVGALMVWDLWLVVPTIEAFQEI